MKKKILVVDDEKLLLKAIERALLKVGYEVFTADGLMSLRDIIRLAPFDLLITDVNLEGDTADNVIELVSVSSPEIKVLVMSGNNNSYQSYQFLEKPFSISSLRQRVKEILDGA